MSRVKNANEGFTTRVKGTLGIGLLVLPMFWWDTVVEGTMPFTNRGAPRWLRILNIFLTPVFIALWPVTVAVSLLALFVQAVAHPFHLLVAKIMDVKDHANDVPPGSGQNDNSNNNVSNEYEPSGAFRQLFEHKAFYQLTKGTPEYDVALKELASNLSDEQLKDLSNDRHISYVPSFRPIFLDLRQHVAENGRGPAPSGQ